MIYYTQNVKENFYFELTGPVSSSNRPSFFFTFNLCLRDCILEDSYILLLPNESQMVLPLL